MEIRTYAALKAAGNAALVRDDNNAFRVLKKQFDPDNGVEKPEPVAIPMTRHGLEEAIARHEEDMARHQEALEAIPLEIAGIRAMLDEMDALNVTAAETAKAEVESATDQK